MARKRTWKQTCQLAASDSTLRQLAASIRDTNASGSPDGTAYNAFKDRAEEIGVIVPNSAYWSFLLWAVTAAIPETASEWKWSRAIAATVNGSL